MDRKIYLVCPAKRSLSHSAKAFLELVKGGDLTRASHAAAFLLLAPVIGGSAQDYVPR